MPLYRNPLNGQSWTGGTLKAALVKDTYTPDLAHDFYNDVNSHLCTGTGVALFTITNPARSTTGSTVTLDCDDLAWTGVTTTDLAWIVVFDDSGTASTSGLVGYLDVRDDGASRDLTNADISIEWSAGGVVLVTFE